MGKSGQDVAPWPETEDAESDVDPATKQGIVKSAFTDVICLIIFLAFLVVMGYITVYALNKGSLKKLTHGIDWEGRVCGLDPAVSTKSKLYWCGDGDVQEVPVGGDPVAIPQGLNLDMPICVEACPSDFDTQEPCPTQLTAEKQKDGTEPPYTIITTLTQSVEYQNTYSTEENVRNFCFPNLLVDGLSDGEPSEASLAMEGLQSQIDSFVSQNPLFEMRFVVGALASDVEANASLLVGVCVAAFLMSSIYLLLLRYIAKPLVYASLIILSLCLIAVGVAFFSTAHNLTGNQHLSPIFRAIKNDNHAVIISDIIGGVCVVLGLLVFLAFCCLRDTIKMVCACMASACECIFAMPTLLVTPILQAAFKLLLLIALLIGFGYLVSVGELSGGSLSVGGTTVNGLSRSFSYTEQEKRFLLIYVFGICWIMSVCDAMQSYVVSYAVVVWYYTPKDSSGHKVTPHLPVIRGFLSGLFLHLGTLAFGAFLIATTLMLRMLFSAFAAQADQTGNPAVAAAARCCTCCLTCFQQCLQYINRNAYIDVAIRSSNFCAAARHVVGFIAREAPGIAILNNTLWIARFLGVVSVAALGGYGTYLVSTKIDYWADSSNERHVSDPVLMAVVAAAICGSISMIFMLVFDQTSDTLLFVFVDNRNRAQASVGLYAPYRLSKLVDKAETRMAKKTRGIAFSDSEESVAWESDDEPWDD